MEGFNEKQIKQLRLMIKDILTFDRNQTNKEKLVEQEKREFEKNKKKMERYSKSKKEFSTNTAEMFKVMKYRVFDDDMWNEYSSDEEVSLNSEYTLVEYIKNCEGYKELVESINESVITFIQRFQKES